MKLGFLVGLFVGVLWLALGVVLFALHLAIRGVILALILLAAYGVLTLLGVVPPIDLPLVP